MHGAKLDHFERFAVFTRPLLGEEYRFAQVFADEVYQNQKYGREENQSWGGGNDVKQAFEEFTHGLIFQSGWH